MSVSIETAQTAQTAQNRMVKYSFWHNCKRTTFKIFGWVILVFFENGNG